MVSFRPPNGKSAPFRTNLCDAFWFVVAGGLGIVGWDIAHLALSVPDTPFRDLVPVVAALLALTTVHVLVVAAVTAPLVASALGARRAPDHVVDAARRIRAWLATKQVHGAARTQASMIAAPVAIAAAGTMAVIVSMQVHDGVRVARNAALVGVLVHLGAALAGLFVFVAVRRALKLAFRRLASTRMAAWIARPWITAAAVLASGLCATVVVLFLARHVIAALDLTGVWAAIVALSAGLLFAWIRTLPPLSLSVRRIVAGGILVVLVAGAGAATFLPSYSNNARALLVDHTTYGKLFNQTQTYVFDWDRDGYTSLFGGNDCAPLDGRIHPGALDVPYNGIDEDCSGEDLRFEGSPLAGRWNHTVPSAVPEQPHMVLLTIDALNPDHLGFHGYDRPTSPNLDAFAQRAVSFTNAYAQGPSTRLSFPSLFTSKYDPQIERAKRGRIPLAVQPGNVTVAEIFRDAGYQTIAVVPHSYFTEWRGITQGFQTVDRSATRGGKKHTSEQVANAIIARLDEAVADGKPILLWAHFYDPHGPFDQPPDSPEFGGTAKDRYDAEIHHTDVHMGRVLKWIGSHLPAHERVVVVTADHGESFDALHRTKHHGYDLHSSVLRVPLFVQAPRAKPRSISAPVTLLDVVPTMVNIARLGGTYAFEGTSLAPAVFRGQADKDRVTFHTFFLPEDVKRDRDPLHLSSVRTSQYNLVHNRDSGVYSLFDFTVDPVEQRNLYDQRPDLAAGLRTQLQVWHYRMASGKDPREMPSPEARKRE